MFHHVKRRTAAVRNSLENVNCSKSLMIIGIWRCKSDVSLSVRFIGTLSNDRVASRLTTASHLADGKKLRSMNIYQDSTKV